MYAISIVIPERRLFAFLIVGLILPLVMDEEISKAASSEQTPTPNPVAGKPILLTDPVPDTLQDGVSYFPQTGHTLRDKFLQYWQQNGGLSQFGYPLTEEFFEPDGPSGALLQVQYFERNRFELHPENQPPYDVLLGTLGLEFHPQDTSAQQEPAPASYFPETGHNLSGKFLDYWHDHGGLAVNGYPISEPSMEVSTDGKEYLTQWFERARFELHSENTGTQYEMLVGQLGRKLSEKKGYPYGWYPYFGYAADFSWIAGYLELYDAGPLMFPTVGCSIFRYGEGIFKFQLNNPSGRQHLFPGAEQGKNLRVVFGRVAGKDEPYYPCFADGEPIYYVSITQPNPAQQ